ncbi:MAG: methyltransferase domain-containing protein [Gammaproteobacteria bacterium]|jgi:SAM-dependent methyltransferase|nr:methyltransferase domain-containing protein [Gammaproteobacteria bacterium]
MSRQNGYSKDWSAYWASGALTSLPQDFRANYEGEIAELWKDQCDGLPEAPRILDICTGNGAVALLLAQCLEAAGLSGQIVAVDAARLDTGQLARRWPDLAGVLERIEFIGQQPFESFTPKDGAFDLLASQYGIEYCDWAAAAERAFSLLRPGGRLAMINHAPDSSMLETMRAEQRDYVVVDDSQAPKLIRRWLEGSLSLPDLQQRLGRAEQVLRQALKRKPSPLLEQVWRSTAQIMRGSARELAAHRTAIGEFLDQVSAGAGRLENMLRVNEAIERQPAWTDVFVDAGLEAVSEREIVYQGRERVGCARVFVRPD